MKLLTVQLTTDLLMNFQLHDLHEIFFFLLSFTERDSQNVSNILILFIEIKKTRNTICDYRLG
jgi:hypothetical protein